MPGTLPHLVPLLSGAVQDGTVPDRSLFVWLEQVIAANLEALFPGMQIVERYPFRVTRDADMAIQELEADDLLETMEESVRQRRFGVGGAARGHRTTCPPRSARAADRRIWRWTAGRVPRQRPAGPEQPDGS